MKTPTHHNCRQCLKSFEVPKWNIGRNGSIYKVYCSNSCAKKHWKDMNPEKHLVGRRKYAKNRGKIRRWQRTGIIGASMSLYNQFLHSQKGLCAICEKAPAGRALALDHDWLTSKPRGLLCFHCNTGLGKFCHETKLLERAVLYLSDTSEGIGPQPVVVEE